MAPFNPYRKWLGIPTEEQPPNHYRLLGLGVFESDADVIEGAAERQTVYLRTFQTGPNAELAERLLNEISAARVCLLDEKSKARYDQQLKNSQQAKASATPLPSVATNPATRSPRKTANKSTPWYRTRWAAFGAGATVMVVYILLFGSGEERALRTVIAVLKDKLATARTSKEKPTATEPAAKSLPPSLKEGLIAYYPFNGNANDESGNGHHITDRQVTIIKKGRAMLRMGGSFEATIPGLPSANMPRTLALTLIPTDRGINPRMVCYWGTPGPLSCFGVSYWKGDAHRWFAYPTDGKVACALSQEAQLVLVYDGVMVKFYKNGVLVYNEELTLKTAAGDRFYIGSKTNHHSEFEGSIDDVRIYNRALSQAEVRQLYEFESSDTLPATVNERLYLSTLKPDWVAAYCFRADGLGYEDGKPITVNGIPAAAGIVLHPRLGRKTADVKYTVPPPYQLLAGAVAFDDTPGSQNPTLTFRITTKDKTLWESPKIGELGKPIGFCVPLAGVSEFQLLTTCNNANSATAVWLDPVLLKSTGGKSLDQIAKEQQARWLKKEE